MPAPEDIYHENVDFTSLALQYPDFAKKLKTNRQLDFSDPGSVKQLMKSLLHRDFDLTLELPDDRLCPPVPNRFNYILYVQKLLDSTQEHYSDKYDPEEGMIGLDIGTGASAIYPLLACRQRPSWRFLATEIDEKSFKYANNNIKANKLGSRIKLLKVPQDSKTIIPTDELGGLESIDILMTNPPFYTSETELNALARQKSRPPNSACTGAPIEMIYPGGEIAFVGQLIEESSIPQIRVKIRWFSSMLGKLGSVKVVIDKLKNAGCSNYAVTEFVQGQKTRRWCVAWSWLSLRPPVAVARGTDAIEKKYLPFPTELDLSCAGDTATAASVVNAEMSKLQGMEWRWRSNLQTGIGRSMTGDVWSRHARRKQIKSAMDNEQPVEMDKLKISSQTTGSKDDEETEDQEPQFVVKISFGKVNDNTIAKASDNNQDIVHLRWLQGQDSAIFESFHGWLKRKVNG